MSEPKWTHIGVFGLCPVKIAGLDTEAPVIAARWGCLDWLMGVSEGVLGVFMTTRSFLDPSYEPMYPVKITGEYRG